MLRCSVFSVLVFDTSAALSHRPNPPRYDGQGHARTLHNGFRVDSHVCFDDQAKAKKSSVFQFDRPPAEPARSRKPVDRRFGPRVAGPFLRIRFFLVSPPNMEYPASPKDGLNRCVTKELVKLVR